MAVTIVKNKDQLVKESCNGGILERKTLGFPKEKGPLTRYSNIFYWSHLTSNYGCIIPEQAHIGFEIIHYVIKGSCEIFNKEQDKYVRITTGDIGLIKAGKGICHSEKLHPRTEILQIWLEPILGLNRKNEPELTHQSVNTLATNEFEGGNERILGSENSPLNLDSKDVTIKLYKYSAGYHNITCPTNFVLSCYILDGFIEIDSVTLGKNDFFKIEEVKEIRIASLINSQLFMTLSPCIPEYQPHNSLLK